MEDNSLQGVVKPEDIHKYVTASGKGLRLRKCGKLVTKANT